MENHTHDPQAQPEPLFSSSETDADAAAAATTAQTAPAITSDTMLEILAGADPRIAEAVSRLRNGDDRESVISAFTSLPKEEIPPAPTLGVYELLRSPGTKDRLPDDNDVTQSVLSRPRRSVWD